MKKCLQGNYDFFSFHDDKKTSAIKKNQKLLRETLLEIGTILDSKILDQIPILISLKNTEGYYLICNLAFENFFGKKKDSIINTTDYSLISKEQADCIKDVEKKVLERNNTCESQEWFTDLDGKQVLFFIVRKPFYSDNQQTIGVLNIAYNITTYYDRINELNYNARHDYLTKLPNRYLFYDLMEKAIYKCNRHQSKIALMFVDLDGFKEINDIYGHTVGDSVLQEVSNRMQQQCRNDDIIARIGGDEFLIAISDLVNYEDIKLLAKRILGKISEPISYNDTMYTIYVTASIGIVYYLCESNITIDQLISNADQAMYCAKYRGKNCICIDQDSKKMIFL